MYCAALFWKNVTYNETLSSNGETLTISPLRLCNVSYFNIDFDDIYFSKNKDLKTVIIEEGIGSISVPAFHGCSNLNKIIFPRTIKTIESTCFQGCNIRCNSIVYSPESTSLLLQHFTRNVLGFCVNTNICTKGNEMLYTIIALMMR